MSGSIAAVSESARTQENTFAIRIAFSGVTVAPDAVTPYGNRDTPPGRSGFLSVRFSSRTSRSRMLTVRV